MIGPHPAAGTGIVWRGGGGLKAGERQFIKSTKVIQRAVAKTELGNISHEIDTCTS